MILCDDNHEEIVYDRGKCPLCHELGLVQDLEEKLAKLEEE